jgi:hypothetical protein
VLGAELSARQVLASTPFDQMFRDRSVVERLGPFGYHAYDLWTYAPQPLAASARDRGRSAGRAVVVRRAATAARGPDGARLWRGAGKNLIVVQVESLQEFVVDFQVAASR